MKFTLKQRRPTPLQRARFQFERLERRDMLSANIVEPVNTMADEISVAGAVLALSAGGKKGEYDDTCHYRIGCERQGRSALIVAGDPNGTQADSPGNHVDPNTADSPFAGVGIVSVVRGKNITGGGTGVAIGPRHVLTAAHVVDINGNGHPDGADYDSIEFWLNLDTDSPVDQPDVIIPAARWYVHPDSFHPGNLYDFFHDDIAVIELSAPLPEGVPFYQLYTGDLAGQTLHMVGHGRSGDGVNGYTVPASRTVKRVGQNVADYFEGQDDRDRPEAIELWQSDFDHPTDTSLNLFGGPSLGNDKETTVGPGDSGGPAFVQVGNNPDKASSYQIGGVITHSLEGLSTFGLFGSGFGGTVVSAYVEWVGGILSGNFSSSVDGQMFGGNGTSGDSSSGLSADRDIRANLSLSAGSSSAHFVSATFNDTSWFDAGHPQRGSSAAWGWFVDATPGDDPEITTPRDQGERNRMDLFTVLAHEVGHRLGKQQAEGDVMAEALTPGTWVFADSSTDFLAAVDVLFAEESPIGQGWGSGVSGPTTTTSPRIAR